MSGFDPVHLEQGTYQLPRSIRKVAVIGGGPSGLAAARHLKDHGLQPRLFERQPVVGGTWNYNAVSAPPPETIQRPTSTSDYTPSLPPPEQALPFKERIAPVHNELLDLSAPPPVYNSLKNNICLPLMQLKDFPWPRDAGWNEPHFVLAKYLQDYARHFGLDQPDILSTSTRVERAQKQPSGSWVLTLKSVKRVGEGKAESEWWTEEFDAVISASGHYSAPNLPNTPGLQELWDNYKGSPGQEVIHSKTYRSADGYKNKNVLLIGCGTSGIDINNDISAVARQVYHSVRQTATEHGPFYARLRQKQKEAITKPNSQAVAEVKLIREPSEGQAGIATFELADGSVLTGVDKVIYCTGYHVSKPYLAQYHDDNPAKEDIPTVPEASEDLIARLEHEQAHRTAIVTNGKWYQNLWEDLLYRFDPTLAFVGAPVGTATFSFFEFQGIALAHVYSGKARIPATPKLEELYFERLRTKGPGRPLQTMGEEGETGYVAELTRWLNSEGNAVEGHIPNFVALRRYSTERILANFSGHPPSRKVVTDLTVPMLSVDGSLGSGAAETQHSPTTLPASSVPISSHA